MRFIDSVISGFDQEKDLLILTSLFEDKRKLSSKYIFANGLKMRFLVIFKNWKTRNVRSFFVLKTQLSTNQTLFVRVIRVFAHVVSFIGEAKQK